MSGLAEKLADPTTDVGVNRSTDHAEANNLRMVFCLAIAGVVTPAQALTQQEFVAKLTRAIRKSETSNPRTKERS